jgi:cbb3-type cytochrome oxidase maturation protein
MRCAPRADRGADDEPMNSLYLLIPLSALLVLAIIAIFGWALNAGQFDDLEREGERILDDEPAHLDADQCQPRNAHKKSAVSPHNTRGE